MDAASNVDQFPYFVHFCKDLYAKFVDECAASCKRKCLDEFYSTKVYILYLRSAHYFRLYTGIFPSIAFFVCVNSSLFRNRQVTGQSMDDVVQLTTQLFDRIKERIIRNVLLKFYNFFFVPMQLELWNEIHGKALLA